jgi:hypothetical protein
MSFTAFMHEYLIGVYGFEGYLWKNCAFWLRASPTAVEANPEVTLNAATNKVELMPLPIPLVPYCGKSSIVYNL